MERGRSNFPPTNHSPIDDTISILVVDDDITCLAIVAAILKKLKYEVVTVKHPNDALCTLRIKGGVFDLVISDVHMPDMNGFELQRAITQEFNLPVVLMSADDKEEVALKGLESGAAFFIMKPITPDDLKDLWQFAAMKRKEKANAFEERQKCIDSDESVNEDDDGKRKSPKKERSEDKNGENSQSYSQKRPKIVWTNSLHNRFLEAIRSIGLERAVPKKILEVMNVPGMTRENVASHLQKYRIFLRRVSDASYKIQYSSSSSWSSHKGLTSRNLYLNPESPRLSTLMPNTLSKLTYQNPTSQLTITTQSRLLPNVGSWQNPTPNLVPCQDHDSTAQGYCGTPRTTILSNPSNIALEDPSNAFQNPTIHHLQSNSSAAANDLDQLCNAIADYEMPFLPLVAQESDHMPVFDLSELELLSPQQGSFGINLQSQFTIQNQPQNNGGESSNLYGKQLNWDSFVNVPNFLDQPQNQIQSNQFSNSQEFTTSSQLNGTALQPTNEEGFANSLDFGTYKMNAVSPAHEQNEDDFLESLLASFQEDHILKGSISTL
ncbi:two-component response regulator ORR24-like [Salvia splendens]|uniref:two-component response regulator ORR24-like n=1 Tax=Salvia splendens TaxID=180675 RepID=UPI001C26C15B|nr:two-component response regulator ORR24-like [Salvia splendens]